VVRFRFSRTSTRARFMRSFVSPRDIFRPRRWISLYFLFERRSLPITSPKNVRLTDPLPIAVLRCPSRPHGAIGIFYHYYDFSWHGGSRSSYPSSFLFVDWHIIIVIFFDRSLLLLWMSPHRGRDTTPLCRSQQ
jgi:hypothetical protein